jgi:hypothetical protein
MMTKEEESQVFGLLSQAYCQLLGDFDRPRRLTVKEQDKVCEIVQEARMIMVRGSTNISVRREA